MEITVKKMLDWIRKGIAFILIISVFFGIGTFVYTKYFVQPTYRASVKFCASGTAEDTGMYDIYRKEYYRSVAPQYQEFLKTAEFYKMVSEHLEEETDEYVHPDRIQTSIRFSDIVEETSVFYVEVEATEPGLAQDIAISVQKMAPLRIQNCDPEGELVVLSEPVLPSSPAGPNVTGNTILGALIGMIFSAVIVVVREMMDNRIKTPEEVTELFGLPVFGVVPDFSAGGKKGGDRT